MANDEIIIRSEGLGKKYVIGHQFEREKYLALRDVISKTAKSAARKTADVFRGRNSKLNNSKEEFWALKDVSFEVKRGEVLGIIGRNGAGKSTLLKILSRITEPTEGRITIKGRVASLLEVGTGFHPELTGRENIYLNGAILGMSRAEIRRKFDEIVAFAEVEKFLDTPVKRFSSGMYVRLAFAVAAHLEPEILIVDEVLAVGDAEFQKKCMGKMSEVASGGRTVLFVSHNLDAVQRLCTSAILLEHGKLGMATSDIPSIVSAYTYRDNEPNQARSWKRPSSFVATKHFLPSSLVVESLAHGKEENHYPLLRKHPISIRIEGFCTQPHPMLTIGIALYNESGNLLFWSYPTDASVREATALKSGLNYIEALIPPDLLNRGRYRVELIGGIHGTEWIFPPNSSGVDVWFEIGGAMSNSPYWLGARPGIIAPLISWSISPVNTPVNA